MTKYRIVPKRDFGDGPGFWMKGAGTHGTGKYGFVKRGFVVTDGMCNIMPGATWFRTPAEAMRAIAIYDRVQGNAEQFWKEIRAAYAGDEA